MPELRMPSLGADMEAGTLVEWKVKLGDTVQRGDIVAVVDTNKGAIDIEIWDSGIVEEIRVEVGAKVPVGTVLAVVRAAGAVAAAAPAVSPAVAPPVAAEPAAGAVLTPIPISPPIPAGRARASPAARAKARELDVDLSAVRGTGPGGAVTLGDVETAARARGAAPAREVRPERAPAPPAPAAPSIRQAIAAAMSRSKREIPHYYLGTDIDVSAALGWLARENERRPVTERLLPAALLLKAVAHAVRDVPEVNGYYTDGAFRPSDAIHLGVAISLRRGGLVAPALHDVDKKPLGELMKELNDLVARTRGGGLRSSELTDATLTVTSLGDLGVETVYGVIYPPQVALVGLGRVQERPWTVGGRVEVRPVIHATLSGDHRVSDGIRGAQFLTSLERHLRTPGDL
jgi:pyruvate dehydrogenase E2 component (dihydrolipoyllysine-residue acetyltransferase)